MWRNALARGGERVVCEWAPLPREALRNALEPLPAAAARVAGAHDNGDGTYTALT
jgi:hypothetical protein